MMYMVTEIDTDCLNLETSYCTQRRNQSTQAILLI